MTERTDFDRIFRLYYEKLYYFALQYIADEEECHDIVSAAYEDVWRNFAQIEAATVRQYLYASVRNKCIDYIRQNKIQFEEIDYLRRQSRHQHYVEFVGAVSSRYVDESHYLEQADNERLVNKVLNMLASPTREILEACYLDGKKYHEVADDMHISMSTVKKHMVRALKMIRELKKNIKSIT